MLICGVVRAESATMPRDTATRANDVKVSVEAVFDTRAADLFPPGQVDLKNWGTRSGLAVDLQFQGEAVKNVSEIGPAMVFEATDDLNESLVKERSPATRPASEAKPQMYPVDTGDAARPPTTFARLRSPGRRATKIVRLRGEIPVIAGGERKTVEITDLPSRFGKFLDDPTLTQAGVKVWIDAHKDRGAKFADLLFKFSGNESAIRDFKVFEGNEEVPTGSGYGTHDPKIISVEHAITKQTVLRLFAVVNEKRLTVPFDLSDIPLP